MRILDLVLSQSCVSNLTPEIIHVLFVPAVSLYTMGLLPSLYGLLASIVSLIVAIFLVDCGKKPAQIVVQVMCKFSSKNVSFQPQNKLRLLLQIKSNNSIFAPCSARNSEQGPIAHSVRATDS